MRMPFLNGSNWEVNMIREIEKARKMAVLRARKQSLSCFLHFSRWGYYAK